MNKLSLTATGLALGITWALAILLVSTIASFFNWGTLTTSLIADLYPGYSTTAIGTLIGMIWAFIDLFIAGIVFAFLYNTFLPRDK